MLTTAVPPALQHGRRLDAIMRAVAAVKQKEEYKGKYNEQNNGVYVDDYNYSDSITTKECFVFITDHNALNRDDKIVKTMGFIGGFVPGYGWIISAATAVSDPDFGLEDAAIEAASNIPYVGNIIGGADYFRGITADKYTVNDMEIQIQIKGSATSQSLDYAYYMVKSGNIVSVRRGKV